MSPRFSVVIPVRNRAEVVMRALNSVLIQGYHDFEVIVIDDGSTDETVAALLQSDDTRVRVVCQEQKGAAAARNHGARIATGEFLTFLDSDDEVTSDWLSCFDSLIRRFDAALVSCGFREVTGDGPYDDSRILAPKHHFLYGTQALFLAGAYAVRRAHFDTIDGFAVEQRAGQHTELALRLLPLLMEEGCETAATSEPLVIRHLGRQDSLRGDDRAVFEGGKRLLEVHAAQYARNPRHLAVQAASTGVRAMRIGETAEARRWLWRAALAMPWNLKGWARFAASLVPPAARWLWPPSDSSA